MGMAFDRLFDLAVDCSKSVSKNSPADAVEARLYGGEAVLD